MTDNENNIFLNHTESENNQDLPLNQKTNNNDLSSYLFKNGNKIVLSGKNMQKSENQNILHQLIISHLNATEIDLSNCSLEIFPEELLKLKHLSSLDLRNNQFINFELLVQKLIKINNLNDLKVDLIDQNQVLMILSQIPKLIFLNGKSTKDAITIVDIDEKDIEEISLQNDLQAYNDIVNKINEKEADQTFVTNFQNKLYDEAEKVKSCLNNNVPNYIYANVVLQSQLELQRYLADKFLTYLDEYNKNIGNILFDCIFKSGGRLVNLVNNLYPKIEEKTDGLRTQLEEAWKSAEAVGDFENKYNEMKKLKDILSGENEIIKMKLNKLENENKIIMDKLLSNKNNIENNNDSYSNSNININNPLNSKNNNSSKNIINNIESKNLINVESKIILDNENIINNTTENNLNNRNNSNINSSQNIFSSSSKQFLSQNGTKADLNVLTPKLLSIKMTKDIMNEIYNSKTIYDQKCYENKIPRETLEQHMYTYLNQKYGLKNLTIEWASSIINAIKMYSNEDCDINLFGKILRNEQEEDSRLVIENLKNNISELLEYYLRSKNPFKSRLDIKKMLERKKDGFLNEEEWKGIINYIYSPEDAQKIENKIINFIQAQNEKVAGPLSLYAQTGVGPTEIFNSTSSNNYLNNLSTFGNLSNANFNLNNNSSNNININNLNNTNSMNYLLSYHGTTRKLSREELFNLSKLKEELNIQYKDFLRLLCIYQIKSRDKYLKNFVKLFRKFDTDLDGILTENEFIGLINEIPCCKNNADEYIFKFLSIIDPFNNKKITFSECISLFSMEIIEDNEQNKIENGENNKEDNQINNNKNGEKENESNKNNNNTKNNDNNQVSLLDKICLE
jgi:hypothetical protein